MKLITLDEVDCTGMKKMIALAWSRLLACWWSKSLSRWWTLARSRLSRWHEWRSRWHRYPAQQAPISAASLSLSFSFSFFYYYNSHQPSPFKAIRTPPVRLFEHEPVRHFACQPFDASRSNFSMPHSASFTLCIPPHTVPIARVRNRWRLYRRVNFSLPVSACQLFNTSHQLHSLCLGTYSATRVRNRA